MNDRYEERYREDRDWRDERPDQYWGRREGFTERGETREFSRYNRDDVGWDRWNHEPHRERRAHTAGDRYDPRDDRERDYRFRAGTWSAGHGGGTGQGYGGALGAWQPGRDERTRYAGRGPKSYRRSDARILEDVNEALTADPDVDATDIEVSVHDGEAALEGTVETRYEKRAAEDCAWSVSGVREVHNRLRVNTLDRSGERGGAFRA